MKTVIAMDSFKGSLSSLQAGQAVADGFRRADSNVETVVRPLADGGEGTVEALVYGLGGKMRKVRVTGPVGGKPVECEYGIITASGTAVIAMSGAAGIALVRQEDLDPLKATTYGVGEVIVDAIRQGCRKFIVGIGGSATNDGGVGMLQAMGYEFLDASGKQIPLGAQGLRELVEIRTSNRIPELADCSFRVACDVQNPLCGPQGASAVFGPQKGATLEMVEELDGLLAHYAKVVQQQVSAKADPAIPGTGAAGGMGFAFLAFTRATLMPGIRIVIEETQLEKFIKDADLVVTGEGRLDAQTVMGKAPCGVAQLAKRYGKPVIALSGCLGPGAEQVNKYGIDAFFPILSRFTTPSEAMRQDISAENLRATAKQVLRLVRTVAASKIKIVD